MVMRTTIGSVVSHSCCCCLLESVTEDRLTQKKLVSFLQDFSDDEEDEFLWPTDSREQHLPGRHEEPDEQF